MFKKIILLILSVVIFFSSSFAMSYTISQSDYNRVQKINNKIVTIVETKYNGRESYIYQMLIDTIDGYLALHKVSERKKVMLLCIKTFLLNKLWYKYEKIYVTIK